MAQLPTHGLSTPAAGAASGCAARRRQAREDVEVIDIPAAGDSPLEMADAIDRALDELRNRNVRWSLIVQLRFLGLSIEQTSCVLSIGRASVRRDWASARAWLKWRLSGD